LSLPDDLDAVKEAAGQVMDPRKVNAWLCRPNDLLYGRTPIFCVRGGLLEEVLAVLEGMKAA
jgi:hypothetical protein